MQRLISLCLWQVVIVGVLFFTTPNLAAQEAGIRIRGPKSTDVFPYERYGPIHSADTLWKIAITVRPDPSFSVYQVMQALFELNPQAFADGNLNHLVNGEYLRIPSPQDIRNIDQLAAKNKAERDDALWKSKAGVVTASASNKEIAKKPAIKK